MMETETGRIVGTLAEARKLGKRVKSTSVLPNWTWEEAIEAYKNSPKWKRKDWFPIDVFQKNQGGRGSCNFYMQGGISERVIMQNFGFYIKLSPEYGYAQAVDGNDMGSLLSESLKFGQTKGLPPYLARHYEKIRKRDFNASDRENALFFCGFEWEPINNYKEAWIASVLGYPVATAIHAGRNYEQLQTSGKFKGFCGVSNGGGNHAVLCDRPIIKNDIPGLEQPGSWGVNIHRDGIATLHEGHFKQTINNHQFWIATGMKINRPKVETKFKKHIVYHFAA